MSPGKKKCQVTRKHCLKMLNKQIIWHDNSNYSSSDANKKLHDTNDSLRKALDQKAINLQRSKIFNAFLFTKTLRIVADF
uniref:Uncharacterized protein n=1 Tax=Wuchereria bancrofti TaxID=6293 RepID=A0AAF5PHH9_WUCBA